MGGIDVPAPAARSPGRGSGSCPRPWSLACAALLALAPSSPARADGLRTGSARAIGRAGAALVSDDGGAALLASPGGLVRRSAWRVQLGMSLHDSDLGYRADRPGAPPIHDHAGPSTCPELAAQGPVGPVVVGIAYLEPGDFARALPAPLPSTAFGEIAAQLPHRYAGTALAYQEQVLAAGAAIRASDWLGLGIGLGVARVRLTERRHIWAGMDGRDPLGDPARDIAVTTDADGRALAATAGALIAPPTLPVELAASLGLTTGARLRGSVAASRVGEVLERPPFPTIDLDAPTAAASLPHVVAARTGVRYLGERVLAEAAGELFVPLGTPADWSVSGVRIGDDTQVVAALPDMPMLLDRRAHGAVRAAADVEVLAGFLWLSAGYAYRTGAARPRRITPAFADLGGHTLAAGAEVYGDGVVVTIGYARSFSAAVTVEGSELRSINPFAGSSAAGTEPVGLGAYRSTHDAFGAALEISWE